jgi:hypothetical protein
VPTWMTGPVAAMDPSMATNAGTKRWSSDLVNKWYGDHAFIFGAQSKTFSHDAL